MNENRILLVEDEEHLLKTIQLNLELEGYKVRTASNGLDALIQFKKEHFNLVILDVMLPLLDGFAVCESIRLENQELPIIFLTAKTNENDLLTGFNVGGDDYITKPFGPTPGMLPENKLLGTWFTTTFS